MNIVELKEVRKEKLDELEQLIKTKNERSEAAYTEAEETRFDELDGEIKALDSQIERAEKEEAIAKRKAPAPMKKEEEKIAEKFSMGEAIRQAKSGHFTGLYAELNQEGLNEARKANVDIENGITIPEFALRADAQNTVTVSAADGGNLVGTDHQGFIPYLYDRTLLGRMGVERMSGLRGNVEIPEETGVVSAAFATEIAAVETQKGQFGKKSLAPKRLAVSAAYSTQLLNQSSPSIDGIIRRQIQEAIAQTLDDAFINGATDIDGLVDVTGTITDGAASYDMLLEIWRKGMEGNLDGLEIVSSPLVATEFMNTFVNSRDIPLLTGERTVTGAPFYTSNKVSDVKGAGTNDSDIFAVNPSTIAVANWGGINMVVDPYTGANSALNKLHVNTFWDMTNLRPAKGYKGLITRA